MKYFIAADIGGSKTAINVYNQNFSLEKSYSTLGAGFATDCDEPISYLCDLLKTVSKEFSISSVTINLGGKNTQQIKNNFSTFFPDANIFVFRESDGNAALKLGEKYDSEIVILAGTGVILIGSDRNGKYVVSGGWGSNISDSGSGYDIGLKAIRQSLLALDSGKPLTAMQQKITGRTEALTSHQNISEIRNIRDQVREHIGERTRKNIASYTKIVEEFALTCESDALNILNEAGIDLAKLTQSGVNALLPHEVKSVTVTGGLVNIADYWKNSFEEYLKQNTDITEFNYVKDGVMLGTAQLAKENFLINERSN